MNQRHHQVFLHVPVISCGTPLTSAASDWRMNFISRDSVSARVIRTSASMKSSVEERACIASCWQANVFPCQSRGNAWEKRYRAVRSTRSRAGQRRYTEADVQRLILLGRATNAGHAIGTIAHLPDPQLRRLLNGSGERDTKSSSAAALDEEFRSECISAVEAMNEPALVGALASSYGAILKRINARVVDDIAELGDELDKIRTGGRK
jgi:DNA-binding transcriptional MerR regulator